MRRTNFGSVILALMIAHMINLRRLRSRLRTVELRVDFLTEAATRDVNQAERRIRTAMSK